MYRICMTATAVASCLVWQMVFAQEPEYSDAEVKEKYAFISCLVHGDENGSHIRKALRMAGNDTNRFARVLRELAAEDTNQTEYVLEDLGVYRTPQSLPFLYSYATNATYGACALKAVFAIEGVNSNSVALAQSYLMLTNEAVRVDRGGATVCAALVKYARQEGVDANLRTNALAVANVFATTRNRNYYWLDYLLMQDDASYRHSQRRLRVLRSADVLHCPYPYQVNFVTNAINELVAYPESALPD